MTFNKDMARRGFCQEIGGNIGGIPDLPAIRLYSGQFRRDVGRHNRGE